MSTDDRLTALERQVLDHDARTQARFDIGEQRLNMRLDALAHGVDGVTQLLTGNGQPQRGLVVRVDRLEQSDGRRSWHVRALTVAALAALAETTIGWLKK